MTLLCNIVPCGKPAKRGPNGNTNGKGMCSMHLERERRNGSPYVVTKVHREFGHNKPDYRLAHRRIEQARGKAADQDCVDCGSPAQGWAYNHSGISEVEGFGSGRGKNTWMTYSYDVDQYEPMCVPCHKKFDLEVA